MLIVIKYINSILKSLCNCYVCYLFTQKTRLTNCLTTVKPPFDESAESAI